MTKRCRIDLLLVDRGLVDSRAKARSLIMTGNVYVEQQRVDKAGSMVLSDAQLEVRGAAICPYVSRGGVKLAGALDDLHICVEGLVVADFGASTGGFCDCMLQRGAARVYAIDVGYGQLHHKLRSDPRVIVMEKTNARYLQTGSLPEQVDLVTIDASFIGLVKLFPAAQQIVRSQGYVLAMVKPQFEVTQSYVGKGGVVRNAALREQAVSRVVAQAMALGWTELGRVDARIRGPKGNQETFAYFQV